MKGGRKREKEGGEGKRKERSGQRKFSVEFKEACFRIRENKMKGEECNDYNSHLLHHLKRHLFELLYKQQLPGK